MTLNEYLNQQAAYAEFAETVVRIIEAGLRLHPGLTHPLTTQTRAKSEVSLRDKLTDRGLLDANNIEAEIKDLAGCRLIFYTETDADRFLQSRIVFENFVVEWDNTKIHHPVGEEPKVEEFYRARHYIVLMKPERLALAEYTRFKGMRAELQIHTMLNNAWSETAHDIIYKNEMPLGFGGKELEGLKRRMARIMTKYLVPAGFEFQKVQHDAERLRQGKEIFDRGPIEQLNRAADNNERCDILERLREQVLPLYDDVPTIHGEMMRVIPEVILAARGTPTKAIKASFASFDGHNAKDVAKAGIEIVEDWRYVDVAGTFVAICRLWHGAGVEEQQLILGAVERLAEHNLDVWRQAGCGAQAELMWMVGGLSEAELKALRPIIVTLCQHVLEPTIRGSSPTYEGVTFRSGPVLIDEHLKRLRTQALEVLEKLFTTAGTYGERRAAFSAMMTATSLPSAGEYGDEAISLANSNSGRIVGFLTAQHPELSFEMKQHVEHELLYLYRRCPAWFDGCREDIKAEGEALKTEIRAFRDAINTDAAYVRQKTLVGFEAVFTEDWDSDGMDIEVADFRQTERIDAVVAEVTTATADAWLEVIKQCAATRSDDGATFGSFVEFLGRLGRAKPEIVLGYLKDVPPEFEDFIGNVLDGLEAGAPAETQRLIRSWIEIGAYLPQIGRHLRRAQSVDPEQLRFFAAKALETRNRAAVIEAAAVVVARPELAASGTADVVFLPAIEFLTEQKDVGWLHESWFLPGAPAFFAGLRPEQVGIVLDNLLELRRINSRSDRIIGALAAADYRRVWDYFGQRLARRPETNSAERPYDPIPHQLFAAQAAMGANANIAVDIVYEWYKADDYLFEWRGGRLAAIAFPQFSDALSDKLLAMIATEGAASLDFISAIVTHYHGAVATHSVCQALVESLPEGDERLMRVRCLLRGTGVLRGEYGMVEALKQKVAEIEPWTSDARDKVRDFAAGYVKSLQQSIAAEQSRAERDVAIRKLEWDKDLDDEPPQKR